MVRVVEVVGYVCERVVPSQACVIVAVLADVAAAANVEATDSAFARVNKSFCRVL
jgi:hypothetical protein